mgnify:FL=1
MKKIIDWRPKDDPFTKEGEILLHEKIHEQKSQKGLFRNNPNRIRQLIKAEKIIGKKINGKVLEIGAGNGYMSIYIAKNREIEQVYVLECTKNGVDLLIRENFIKNKVKKNKYELVLGSFNSIPLIEKFDFVLAFGALHHSANLQRTIDEVFKTLKPGGYLIAQEPYTNDNTQNNFFIEMKNKVVSVQGLIEIKNELRDDNFYRKCEYLTASYHAGFEKVILKRLINIKRQISYLLKFKKHLTNNMLLILNKGNISNSTPNRWK